MARPSNIVGFVLKAILWTSVCSLMMPLYAGTSTKPGTVYGFGDYDKSGVPTNLNDVIKVTAAMTYTYALRRNGTIALWGSPLNKQIEFTPSLSNVVDIAAGDLIAMALTGDGRVHVWGWPGMREYDRVITVPAEATNVISIAAGATHCLALRADGTVIAWGSELWGDGSERFGETVVPAGLSNVVQIAARGRRSFALTAEGRVVMWGSPWYGQVPDSVHDVIQISPGIGHVLALLKDRTVTAWGLDVFGQASVPPGLTNILAVAAGERHSLALKADGTVVAWGENVSGQSSVPAGFPKATAIAGGGYHTVAITQAPVVDSIEVVGGRAGGDAILRASVAASFPWTGIWQKNGATIFAGPSASSLILTNVQEDDGGSYSLIASNEFGMSTSAPASLWISSTAPWEKAAPQQIVVEAGASATFTSPIVGSEPLTYQWRRNGSPIPGQTNALLSIAPVSAADEGEYRVYVSNRFGVMLSKPQYLVATVPYFVSQPRDITAAPGWNIEVTVEVLSPRPVSYQWLKDGTAIPGATNAAIRFPAISETDAGRYAVRVSSELGSVISRAAELRMTSSAPALPEPGIVVSWGSELFNPSSAPADLTNAVSVAGGLVHTVALRSDGTLRLWGSKPNVDLLNPPDSATNVTAIAAGPYHTLALRSDGTVVGWGSEPYGQYLIPDGISNIVAVAGGYHHSLLLNENGHVLGVPEWSYVPDSLSNVVGIAAGEDVSYALTADGQVLTWPAYDQATNRPPAQLITDLRDVVQIAAGEYGFIALRNDGTVVTSAQWALSDWSPVDGTTNAVSVAAGRGYAALLGNGEVRAWGAQGFVDSPRSLKAVQLAAGLAHLVTITPHPFFEEQPQAISGYVQGGITLNAKVRSASPLSYQWFHEDLAIEGATNSTLQLELLRYTDGGRYRLLARNSKSAVFSEWAPVTVEGPAEFVSITADRVYREGETIELYAVVRGNPTPLLQWYFGNIPVPGATNASFLVSNSDLAMGGTYSLIASNAYGRVGSPEVHVEVHPSAPLIVEQPTAPSSLPEGSRITLQVRAVGSGPLSYEWFFNDNPVPGATNAFQIEAATAAENGQYYAVVSNSLGQAKSATVLLTTTPAPPSPEIVTGNLVVHVGKSVRLEAVARGSGSASYHWRREGRLLAGETNSSLVFSSINPTNAGSYSVIAGNALGTNESAPAYITVLPANPLGVVRSFGNIPDTNLLAEAIAAGRQHAIALLPDGTVRAWSGPPLSHMTPPAGVTNVVAIAAGLDFNVALTMNGKVAAWGSNIFGVLFPPADLADVIAISAGSRHAMALKRDGSVVAWGDPTLAEVPASLSNVVGIAAGDDYSLALLNDGRVRAWTGERFVSTNVPASITNIMYIAAGSQSYGLDSTGRAWTWGGAVGGARLFQTNLAAIATRSGHAMGLRTNGTVFYSNPLFAAPPSPPGLSNIVAVAEGTSSRLFLSTEPKLFVTATNRVLKKDVPVTLTAIAAGVGPLSVQWFRDSVAIPAATNQVLDIPAFAAGDQGSYSVTASNSYAVVRAEAGSLTLGLPPQITRQPTNQTVLMGTNGSFLVEATGGGFLQYQWMLGGTNLLNARSATLVLTNAIPHDSGQVSVRVSSPYGETVSDPAEFRVVNPAREQPIVTTHLTSDKLATVVHVEAGRTYRVLTSTNLVEWKEINFFIGEPGDFQFNTTNLTEPHRFYRVVSP